MRAKAERAAAEYRRATAGRVNKRKQWVRTVAALMVAEMRALKRKRAA
jgi:hypothetical protein